MLLFHNDYNEACHPVVLERINNFINLQMPGYGTDRFCSSAAEKIRTLCKNNDLAVHFLVGGTQTNLTVISAALRPHQGVLGAMTAHVNVHETGAIEATGHKVIGLPSDDGKITAEQVSRYVAEHRADPDGEHTVQPKMVYISNPTELGTIYSLGELEALSAVCKRDGLYLYVDGARLGYGLTAADNDVTLGDLARLCDVFYIGGTKVGAMFGEAVVFSNSALAEDFRYIMKQKGGMLAKGWLLGLQFDALFTDDLYYEVSRHANEMADRIRGALNNAKVDWLIETSTNQLFPVLPNAVLDKLSDDFTFVKMDRISPTHSAARFCTSWATKEESVDALCAALTRYLSD